MHVPACTHLNQVGGVVPTGDGCEECLRTGGRWVHLRMCMTCGHIGCCDDSPGRHARRHSTDRSHPVIQSYEPSEDWWYCFVDDVVFRVRDIATFHHS